MPLYMLKYKIKQLNKKEIMLFGKLDVHDLQEEEIKFVQRIIDSFRIRKKTKEERVGEKINFSAWPLGVKGKLTREEIYDYL